MFQFNIFKGLASLCMFHIPLSSWTWMLRWWKNKQRLFRTILGVPLTWRRLWCRCCDADTRRPLIAAFCRICSIIPEGPITTLVAIRGEIRRLYSPLYLDIASKCFYSCNSSFALSLWCHCLISACLTIYPAWYQDKLCKKNEIFACYGNSLTW